MPDNRNDPYTLILAPEELPPDLRNWMEQAENGTVVVAMERLDDGRVIVRALPEVEPLLLTHIRVTMAKYHAALMNLT